MHVITFEILFNLEKKKEGEREREKEKKRTDLLWIQVAVKKNWLHLIMIALIFGEGDLI